jgi:hypothetical protein
MLLTDPIALELWRRASEEEIGLCIPVPEMDKRQASNILYRVRQAAGGFTDIKLITPGPHPDEIWLCKEMVQL